MEMRPTALLFPKTRHSGPIAPSVQLRFARDVVQAVAGLGGYAATFENRADHHLGKLDLEVTARIDPADARNLIVDGALGLRDWSNEWDDKYEGVVRFAVIAE